MLTLALKPWQLAVVKLPPDATPPIAQGAFWSLTHTPHELSLVCEETYTPADALSVTGPWNCFEVAGPLDFALIGILSGITAALAAAQISVFALSTYDTDFILVRADKTEAARAALLQAGYGVHA